MKDKYEKVVEELKVKKSEINDKKKS